MTTKTTDCEACKITFSKPIDKVYKKKKVDPYEASFKNFIHKRVFLEKINDKNADILEKSKEIKKLNGQLSNRNLLIAKYKKALKKAKNNRNYNIFMSIMLLLNLITWGYLLWIVLI